MIYNYFMINEFYSLDNEQQYKFWTISVFSLWNNLSKINQKSSNLKVIVNVNSESFKDRIYNFLLINDIKLNIKVNNVKDLQQNLNNLEKFNFQILISSPTMWNYFYLWEESGHCILIDNDTIFYTDLINLINKMKNSDNHLSSVYTGVWMPGHSKIPENSREYLFLKNNVSNFTDKIEEYGDSHIAGSFIIVNIKEFKLRWNNEEKFKLNIIDNILLQFGQNDNHIKVSDELFIMMSEHNNPNGVYISNILIDSFFWSLMINYKKMNQNIKENNAIIHLMFWSKHITHKDKLFLMTDSNFKKGWHNFFKLVKKSDYDNNEVKKTEKYILSVLKKIKFN